jgi:cell division protein FtsB
VTPARARAVRWSVAVAVVAVVAGLLLAGPVLGYLGERRAVDAQGDELAGLQEDNAELERRLERYRDPSQIERVARDEFGLVEPGEESYAVLPPATAGVVLPQAWPFDRLAGPVARAAAAP